MLWLALLFSFNASPVGSARYSRGLLHHLVDRLVPPAVIRLISTYIPGLTFDTVHFLFRKGAHVAVFGILAILLWWALEPGRWAPVKAWLLATAAGAVDEWRQAHMATRTGSWEDVALDSAAALLAIIIVAGLARLRRRTSPHQETSTGPNRR